MIDRREVLRYLGTDTSDGINDIMKAAIKKASALSPKHIAAEFSVREITQEGVFLENGFFLKGGLAKNSLKECDAVIALAATLTLEADRLIGTAGNIVNQAVMNAVLSAAVEDYLDAVEARLNAEYNKKGLYLTKRFSPGYYDLPLSLQSDILKATNAEKLLGIRLTPNMLLVPVKSVTALIGISKNPRDNSKHKCADCDKPCVYRR